MHLRQLVAVQGEHFHRSLLSSRFLCDSTHSALGWRGVVEHRVVGQLEDRCVIQLLFALTKIESFLVLSIECLAEDEFVAFGRVAAEGLPIVELLDDVGDVDLRWLLLNLLLKFVKEFLRVLDTTVQVIHFLTWLS